MAVEGVESEFGNEDRAVAGDVVEALEVVFELGGVFEEDVEGGEVGVAEFKVFGGGEVGVAEGEVGCELAGEGEEVFEGLTDLEGAEEADEVGADFIGDEKGSEGGMGGVV